MDRNDRLLRRAASFAQMLVGRAAVSIGEAGCTPPAHSLISDIFPAERWTGALVVFVVAGPVGALVAAVGGGWMVQSHGWRAAFILGGVIGPALAILIRTTVREPLRGDRGEAEALMPTLRTLLGNRSFPEITISGAASPTTSTWCPS